MSYYKFNNLCKNGGVIDMLEKIINVLSSFFERYFIQTLVAFVISVVIYYFTPINNLILDKLGKDMYLLTLLIIFFLVVELIIFIFKVSSERIQFLIEKKKYDKDKIKENIEEYKEFVDGLKPEERDILEYLLKNNNMPIILVGELFYSELLKYCCNKTEFVVSAPIRAMDVYKMEETIPLKTGMRAYKYKLKEDLYKLYKYMKKNGIGISNFDNK